jgi:hypothetical protein
MSEQVTAPAADPNEATDFAAIAKAVEAVAFEVKSIDGAKQDLCERCSVIIDDSTISEEVRDAAEDLLNAAENAAHSIEHQLDELRERVDRTHTKGETAR